MSLHCKIKSYALVCPGECGKTKANQFTSRSGWGKQVRTWTSKARTATFAFPRFKWLCFHLFPFCIWLPPTILFVGIHIFYSIQSKNEILSPWRRLLGVFCKLRKKPHLLWRTRDHICCRVKRLTSGHEWTIKIRAEGPFRAWFAATQPPSCQAPFSRSQGKQTRVV